MSFAILDQMRANRPNRHESFVRRPVLMRLGGAWQWYLGDGAWSPEFVTRLAALDWLAQQRRDDGA